MFQVPYVFHGLVALAVYVLYRLIETDVALQPQRWHGLHRKTGPFFEGWYYKVVTANRDAVVAVITGVSLGDKRSRKDSHAFVFLTVNGSDVHYYRYPLSEFSVSESEDAVDYRIGPNNFSEHGMQLALSPKSGDDATLTVHGALAFRHLVRWPVRWNSVGAMGWFGWLSFLQCYHHVISMDHDVQGILTAGSQSISFNAGKGYTDKDWGTRFPDDWIWLQCNNFQGHLGSSLFFSLARTPFYVTTLPGFICGFYHQGLWRLFRFATYTGAQVVRLQVWPDQLNIVVEDRRWRLQMRVQRSPDVSLLYGPRGGRMLKFIPETVRASVHVVLTSKRNGTVMFSAAGSPAGLEVVERKPGGMKWLKRRLNA